MKNEKHISENRFFIGANTCCGFVGYMGEIFGGLKKLYIIKGGPGTGKSTVMKRLALKAASLGYDPELYYCSSDSSSLDGFVLREKGIGFVDGTSPHLVDPKYPGACEEIINLGEFWSSELLESELQRIKELSEKKSSLFETVYKYLGVIKSLNSERDKYLSDCFDTEKAEGAARRIMSRFERGERFTMIPRQISSVGMNGSVIFDTYQKLSKKHITIIDKRGFSSRFCDILLKGGEELKQNIWVSRNTLLEPDALYFPSHSLSVISSNTARDDDKVINTERFFIKSNYADKKTKIRFISGVEKELEKRVGELFEEISTVHFASEEIYSRAMNFKGVKALTEKLEKQILKD